MARRVKVDPRQSSFDFELAAALAAQLDAERDYDEEANNNEPNRPIFSGGESVDSGFGQARTVLDSRETPIHGNAKSYNLINEHKAGWLFNFGSMGFEPAGRLEGAGEKPDVLTRPLNILLLSGIFYP